MMLSPNRKLLLTRSSLCSNRGHLRHLLWIRSSSSSGPKARGNAIHRNNCRSDGSDGAVPAILRHGPDDGLVTLNVGGKTFQTLRSTVAQNAVLMDHVVRAERNSDLGGAVFVDRDPKHFGTILSYLRNKADGVHGRSTARRKRKLFGDEGGGSSGRDPDRLSTAVAKSISTLLPKDSNSLREIYLESVHYDMPELTNCIVSQRTLARMCDLFGSKNPLEMTAAILTFGRRALIMLGGMATGAGGWVYAQAAAARAKTDEFVAQMAPDESDDNGSYANDASYWEKQAETWKSVADKWRGEPDEK
ncbi:hypothetical protein ACHAWF_003255 [Thalassiosira exigua]